jgi:hypothetical protein
MRMVKKEMAKRILIAKAGCRNMEPEIDLRNEGDRDSAVSGEGCRDATLADARAEFEPLMVIYSSGFQTSHDDAPLRLVKNLLPPS